MLAAGLALAAGPPAQAAEVLTWDDCVRVAARHNPDLAAAQEGVVKARADYAGSYSPLLPQLSADAGYSDSTTTTRSRAASVGVSVEQPLFAGGRHVAGVRKSRAELDAAEAQVAVARGDLFPEISATGSLGRGGREWALDRDEWSAGLSIAYPFWSGGQALHDLRSAQASARQAAALNPIEALRYE